MLSGDQLAKMHGAQALLSGVTLQVARGRCAAIAGAPGAGKSTLLAVLGTAIRPTAGRLQIAGIDAVRDPYAARRHLCWLTGRHPTDGLRAGDYLHFLARARGNHSATVARNALERVGLAARASLDSLTPADRSALDVAVAFVTRADLLLVDEPFGSDPRLNGLWRDTLTECRRDGRTVIFTAASGVSIPRVWDLLVTLEHGRVGAEGQQTRVAADTSWRVMHA